MDTKAPTVKTLKAKTQASYYSKAFEEEEEEEEEDKEKERRRRRRNDDRRQRFGNQQRLFKTGGGAKDVARKKFCDGVETPKQSDARAKRDLRAIERGG